MNLKIKEEKLQSIRNDQKLLEKKLQRRNSEMSLQKHTIETIEAEERKKSGSIES